MILGVIYEVNREECFYAREGGKSYCNGNEINVSGVPKLGSSLIATGFPYYDFKKIQLYLEILDKFMKNTHGLRRMGSAAVDLAYVACGRFEGFFEPINFSVNGSILGCKTTISTSSPFSE